MNKVDVKVEPKRGYKFLKRETVLLYGDETDPAIIASKKRIEALGRKVEVTLRPAHDTGVGICGQHICSCTEPCKSIHYKKVSA